MEINQKIYDYKEPYKMTELGELPESWEVVRLGEYLKASKLKNKESKNFNVYTVSNIKGFILSDDFFDKRVYSKNLQNYKIVKKGYFAYNPARVNVGSIALFQNTKEGLVSPMYVVFYISDRYKIFEEYLYLLLKK